jgi:hypothetical protein
MLRRVKVKPGQEGADLTSEELDSFFPSTSILRQLPPAVKARIVQNGLQGSTSSCLKARYGDMPNVRCRPLRVASAPPSGASLRCTNPGHSLCMRRRVDGCLRAQPLPDGHSELLPLPCCAQEHGPQSYTVAVIRHGPQSYSSILAQNITNKVGPAAYQASLTTDMAAIRRCVCATASSFKTDT